jgi:hypothetical protein
MLRQLETHDKSSRGREIHAAEFRLSAFILARFGVVTADTMPCRRVVVCVVPKHISAPRG